MHACLLSMRCLVSKAFPQLRPCRDWNVSGSEDEEEEGEEGGTKGLRLDRLPDDGRRPAELGSE